MRVSANIVDDEGTKAEIQIKFSEGDKSLHNLTIFAADPRSYDGSRGMKISALRQAQDVLAQMQEVVLEVLKPEHDAQALSTTS